MKGLSNFKYKESAKKNTKIKCNKDYVMFRLVLSRYPSKHLY